jgi:hypothetical protein
VLGGQLQADQQRRGERGQLRQGLAARPEGDEERKSRGRGDDRPAQRLQPRDLAPDAEGGVAVCLVGDGARDELVQTGAQESGQEQDQGHREERDDKCC